MCILPKLKIRIYIYIKKQQKTKNIGKEIRFVGLEVAMRKEKWDEGDPKV